MLKSGNWYRVVKPLGLYCAASYTQMQNPALLMSYSELFSLLLTASKVCPMVIKVSASVCSYTKYPHYYLWSPYIVSLTFQTADYSFLLLSLSVFRILLTWF